MSVAISTRILGLSAPNAITGRRIRVAVVGCGRISKNHFQSVLAHDNDIQLVGVCDTNPQRLDAAASALGVPGYAMLSDVLAEAEADIVILGTPSGLHARQAIQAAQAGCHVVTEKPM